MKRRMNEMSRDIGGEGVGVVDGRKSGHIRGRQRQTCCGISSFEERVPLHLCIVFLTC